MQLATPKTRHLIPNSINVDRDELKRLKACRLISDELYIGWAFNLTFGKNDTIFNQSKIEEFCENWSFDVDEYIPDSKAKFKLNPSKVTIGLIKFSQKVEFKMNIQLELDLKIENNGN